MAQCIKRSHSSSSSDFEPLPGSKRQRRNVEAPVSAHWEYFCLYNDLHADLDASTAEVDSFRLARAIFFRLGEHQHEQASSPDDLENLWDIDTVLRLIEEESFLIPEDDETSESNLEDDFPGSESEEQASDDGSTVGPEEYSCDEVEELSDEEELDLDEETAYDVVLAKDICQLEMFL